MLMKRNVSIFQTLRNKISCGEVGEKKKALVESGLKRQNTKCQKSEIIHSLGSL